MVFARQSPPVFSEIGPMSPSVTRTITWIPYIKPKTLSTTHPRMQLPLCIHLSFRSNENDVNVTTAAVYGRGKVTTRFTTSLELFFLQTASNHRMRNCIFTTLTTLAKGETLTFVDKHSTAFNNINVYLRGNATLSLASFSTPVTFSSKRISAILLFELSPILKMTAADEIAVVIVGDKSRNLLY